MPKIPKNDPNNGKDYYFENGLMVMTEDYHLKRGYCCGSKCRHCPFEYKNVANKSANKSVISKKRSQQ